MPRRAMSADISFRGRRRLTRDVVVAHAACETAALEPLHQLARQHGRAMPSAGAAETDRQVTLPFALIERNQKVEKAADLVDKAPRLRLRHHVLVHARVLPGERPQFMDEKRVR